VMAAVKIRIRRLPAAAPDARPWGWRVVRDGVVLREGTGRTAEEAEVTAERAARSLMNGDGDG
jgi:hypothetical protein